MAKNNAPAMDYEEHEATYVRFLLLIKWSIGITALVLAFMAIFLV